MNEIIELNVSKIIKWSIQTCPFSKYGLYSCASYSISSSERGCRSFYLDRILLLNNFKAYFCYIYMYHHYQEELSSYLL